MKEKPICVEQGQKLAKEVTEPLQNLWISVKAKVMLETSIYCALTVCQALCWVLSTYDLISSLHWLWGRSDWFPLLLNRKQAWRCQVTGKVWQVINGRAGFQSWPDSRTQILIPPTVFSQQVMCRKRPQREVLIWKPFIITWIFVPCQIRLCLQLTLVEEAVGAGQRVTD